MLKPTAWTAAVLFGASIAAPAWAQAPGQRLSAGPAYTSTDGKAGPPFPRVDVVVRLTGANGTPAALRAKDLRLFSSDAQVASGSSLRTFAETGYGVKTILALDLSGSMSGAPLAAVRSTMARFVNRARTQDLVEVLTIADDTRIEVPFGADKATLAERLKNVSSRGTLTRLNDGMLFAIGQLEGAPPALRQLTVISDGHDEGSKHSIDEVIQQAVADRVQIDSIGLSRSHPEFLRMLERISQETGGRYVHASSPQELDGLIDQGIRALQATPVVAFKTEKLAADGLTHKVELRWQPGNLAASVDVHAPLIANPWLIWVWVLVACFVAGAALLIIARRRRRLEAAPPIRPVPAQPQPVPAQENAHPPATWPGMTNAPEIKPTPPPRTYTPTVVLEEAPPPPPKVRAKTRVAEFFDARPDGTGATLEATAGPVAGKRFPVSGEMRIGATAGNDLVIAGDPTLSGFHARVKLADSVLTIEDARSTNGTHVNGARLGEGRKLLKAGDEIRLGRSIFKVRNE
jgi:Mg-chelatase subunit ChlD